MDRMPIPSMASRILASSLMSRPDSRNEITAAITTIASQGTWYGLSLPGCNFAMNALVNAAVNARVPMAKAHVGAEHREAGEESRPRPDGAARPTRMPTRRD